MSDTPPRALITDEAMSSVGNVLYYLCTEVVSGVGQP